MERPCPLFKDGLCILGENCPLSHETGNDDSDVGNPQAPQGGLVKTSAMASHPAEQWMMEQESHNDEEQFLDQPRNPKIRNPGFPDDDDDDNNNSLNATFTSDDNAEAFKKSRHLSELTLTDQQQFRDQDVENSNENVSFTPQSNGVNTGLENQAMGPSDQEKQSHFSDGINPFYAQANSSGFPSTTFSQYGEPNQFFLVRTVHGNLVYLQPRIPLMPIPSHVGHPQQSWFPPNPVPSLPFNPMYHHQSHGMPGLNVAPHPTPHFNQQRPMMAPRLAMVNPFSYHHPGALAYPVTSQPPSSGFNENTQPWPNQQPIIDAFQHPCHFQHYAQTLETTANQILQNVGDQTLIHQNTEPSAQQDLQSVNCLVEPNIADQPSNKVVLSQNDNFFNGNSGLQNSNQVSAQPEFHSHQYRIETALSGHNLSNAEVKPEPEVPRVYSVDELEKGFFKADAARLTNSVSPKAENFHFKTESEESVPLQIVAGNVPLQPTTPPSGNVCAMSSESRNDSVRKRLPSSGRQLRPPRPAPRHAVRAVEYFCHPCKKNIPNLCQGLCPFCSQSFFEDRSTVDVAADDVKREEWVLEGNKIYFCYVCKKDFDIGPGLNCPFCGDFFIEEKATVEPEVSVAQVQVAAKPGIVYFCYNCEKDVPDIGNDLLCTFCGGSFVEEKEEALASSNVEPVRPETGARSKIRPSGDANKSLEGCTGFAFVPLPHLTQNFLDKEHKLVGLDDQNPFSALIDNHESMTEFPPIPQKSQNGNEKFPFDTAASNNPVSVFPAVRGLNFIADRIMDHVGMSDPEDCSDGTQSDEEEKPEVKVVNNKAKKKRERRRLAKKEHKKQEQILEEKRELAKKKEAEIKLSVAEKQNKLQEKKKAEREKIAKSARQKLEKQLNGPVVVVAKPKDEPEKKKTGPEETEVEVVAGINEAEKSKEFSYFLLPECDLKKSIFEAEKLFNASNFKLANEKFSLGLELLANDVFLSQTKNLRLRHKLFVFRAETSIRLERFEDAAKDATEAIRLNGNLAKPYLIRAESNWKMGNTDKVAEDLLTAGKLDPAHNVLL